MDAMTKQLLIQLSQMLEDNNCAYMICVLDKESEEESFSGVNVTSQRQAIKMINIFKDFVVEAAKSRTHLN
jgi:hypothetical protein